MLKYKISLTFGLKQDTNRSLQYFSPVFHVWNINGYIGSHNTDRGLEIALDFNPQRSTTELLSPVVKLLFFPGKARNTHVTLLIQSDIMMLTSTQKCEWLKKIQLIWMYHVWQETWRECKKYRSESHKVNMSIYKVIDQDSLFSQARSMCNYHLCCCTALSLTHPPHSSQIITVCQT